MRRLADSLRRLETTLGAPGLMIAGFSALSFAFGLFVLLREYDRPRHVARLSARLLLENWIRSPDYLGLTLADHVDAWRAAEAHDHDRHAGAAPLQHALARLGDELDGIAARLPIGHVEALELTADDGRLVASWRSPRGASAAQPPERDAIAMTRPGDRPAVVLDVRYRMSPAFVEGVSDLETAYHRVLLALLGLSGFSLLCLGYLILHTRALSERVAREAAQAATLDLADRTCHELGNGVFVLSNERRNLAEHLDLVERFIAEGRPAREAAARRAGLDPAAAARWEHALAREYAARGIDPDLELRASVAVARDVCRQIGACSDYISMTVRELDGFLKHASVPVAVAPVAVADCLEEAVALLRPRVEASGVAVAVEVEGGQALRARADHRLLIHALVNLLKNAIEAAAGRDGAPRVELTARAEGRAVAIEVRDNGPGLGPDARRRAFESGFSTKGPGRGRGLEIVRESVHAQGGEISAGAGPGGGASFRITLERAGEPGSA